MRRLSKINTSALKDIPANARSPTINIVECAGCKELDISLMKRSESPIHARSMPDPSIQNPPPRREEKRKKKKRSTNEKLYRARSTEQYVPRSGIVAAFKTGRSSRAVWRIYRAIKGIKSSLVKFRTSGGRFRLAETHDPT